MNNLRKCEKCDYTAFTIIEVEYPHRECGGLMKLIAIRGFKEDENV